MDPNFLSMIIYSLHYFLYWIWELLQIHGLSPSHLFLVSVNSISMKGPWISFQPGGCSEMLQWDQSGLDGDVGEQSPVPAQSSTVISVIETACPFAAPWTWLGIQKDLKSLLPYIMLWFLSLKNNPKTCSIVPSSHFCWETVSSSQIVLRKILLLKYLYCVYPFVTEMYPHIWINWFSCSWLALMKIYASCLSVEIIILN